MSVSTTIDGDTKITAWTGVCLDCHGEGVESFSTFADYRALILAQRAWDGDDDEEGEDSYPYDAEESGRRPCSKCGGTGKGDGNIIRSEYTA